jgi:hypothetical protein
MSPLLAPLFAQLVSLQVGDRTEARYTTLTTKQLIGATTPVAGLTVSVGRSNLLLGYSPVLFMAPLERAPRELYVFHNVLANASYRYGRTSFTLNNTLGIGTLNFQIVTAQPPTAPTNPSAAATNGDTSNNNAAANSGSTTSGTPTSGTPTSGMPTSGMPTSGTPTTTTGATRPDITNRKVRYLTLTNSLGMAHALTRRVGVGLQAGTTMARGLGGDSTYTPLRSWFVGGGATYAYRFDRPNAFNSSLTLLKTWSSIGNEVATLAVGETWAHQFNKRSSSSLGAGLNVTRFSQTDGLRGFSVFPTFNAGVVHQTFVAHDTLYMAANTFAAPVLDPLRALVDPRVGVSAQLGYTHKKLFVGSSASAALSVAPTDNDKGAVNAANADLRASYQLGKLTQLDTGARVSYQTYQVATAQRDTVVPLNWAAFVGVSFGYQVQLAGHKQ